MESCGNKGEKKQTHEKKKRKQQNIFYDADPRQEEKGIKIEVFSSHDLLPRTAANLWSDLVLKFFIVCVYSGFISPAVAGGLMVMDDELLRFFCYTFQSEIAQFQRNQQKRWNVFVANFTANLFVGDKTEKFDITLECCMQINSSWKFRRAARRRANSFMSWQNLHNLCLRRAHKRLLRRAFYV